ncbi:toxin glutamine deamidase domain-containing protein, partial [Kitasatospora sp. NPDC059571]|uniref:toxin glutamine deamidase domain-containing protein n=1 Tax=Kitasatospora sp. NPDC059571 TaxID=3346871 RepID=UPI0036810302
LPSGLIRMPAGPSRPAPRTAPQPRHGADPAGTGHRPAADRPSPGPEPRRPEHRLPEPGRPDRTPGPDHPADHAAPDHAAPDRTAPDRTAPDHASDHAPEHRPADPDRPATADRPHGPGGLVEPTHHDRARVENAVPRDADGTPRRHPDPEGDWPRAINGDDPDAPGRRNNCVDVALATVDTYSGHPTPAAARTPDHDADGRPSDRGERGGRDRIENALGGRFSDLGDGPSAYRRLEDTLRREGHGSQAVIITRDADGRAHAWNAVNHQGRITYVDAQTGRRSSRPLHSGDHGVFAVPLGPDRRPAAPAPAGDHRTPDGRTDRRAPEEAAGTKRTPDADDYGERLAGDHDPTEDGYIKDPPAPENNRAGHEWQALADSQQEPFGSSELGQMVEAARADDAFFQHYAVPNSVLTRHPNVANLHESVQANYAAFRFVVEPGGTEQVLISRNWPARVNSVPPVAGQPWTNAGHSEKVATEYLKHVQQNLTPPQRVKLLEVYSERAPCKQSGCARILYTTFGKVRVAHSVPHPDDGTSADKMKAQVQKIVKNRAQIMAEDRRYYPSGNPAAPPLPPLPAGSAAPAGPQPAAGDADHTEE